MTEAWIFGVHAVSEALKSPERVRQIWVARSSGGATDRLEKAARIAGTKFKIVPKEAIDRVCEAGARHQGVAAEVAGIEATSLDELLEGLGETPLVLLLDGIEDPGNLGAILRSAYALGADGVILPKDRAAGLSATVVKRSSGAALRLPIAQVTNLKHALEPLKDAGLWSAAAVMEGEEVSQVDLQGPLALVVGAEGKGVRPTLARRCDHQVSIPMVRAFDSLNVSVATGILLFEVSRQRAAGKRVDRGARPA